MEFYAVYSGGETPLCQDGLYQGREVDISQGPLLDRGLDLLSQIVCYSFNTFPEVLLVRLTIEVPERQVSHGPYYLNRWWSGMQRYVASRFDGMRGRQKRQLNMIWARDIDASHEGCFNVALLFNAVAFRECHSLAEIERLLGCEFRFEWSRVLRIPVQQASSLVNDVTVTRVSSKAPCRKQSIDRVFGALSHLARTGAENIEKQETLFVTKKGAVPYDLRRKKRAPRMTQK